MTIIIQWALDDADHPFCKGIGKPANPDWTVIP
jgi:hypothetical protein